MTFQCGSFYVPTAYRSFRIGSFDSAGATVNTGATGYINIEDVEGGSNATEANRNKSYSSIDCVCTGFYVYVDSNATGSASTITLRANAADVTGATISVAAGSTGLKTATAPTGTVIANDPLCIKVVNGGGGDIRLTGIGALFSVS